MPGPVFKIVLLLLVLSGALGAVQAWDIAKTSVIINGRIIPGLKSQLSPQTLAVMSDMHKWGLNYRLYRYPIEFFNHPIDGALAFHSFLKNKCHSYVLMTVGGVIGSIGTAMGIAVTEAVGIKSVVIGEVSKGTLYSAQTSKDHLPVEWERSRNFLSTFIQRVEPNAINKYDREAEIRDIRIQHQVRNWLQFYQDATENVYHHMKDMSLLRSQVLQSQRRIWLAEKNQNKEAIKYELSLIKGSLEELLGLGYRFGPWIEGYELAMDYHAQHYTFYEEDRPLFNKWWDAYYQQRKRYKMSETFSKLFEGGSMTIRFGMWIATHPWSDKRSDELQLFFDKVNKYTEEAEAVAAEMKSKYNLTLKPIASELQDVLDRAKEHRDDKSFAYFGRAITMFEQAEIELMDNYAHINRILTSLDQSLDRLEQTSDISDKSWIGQLSASELGRMDQLRHIKQQIELLVEAKVNKWDRWRFHKKDELQTMLVHMRNLSSEMREMIFESLSEKTEDKLRFKTVHSSNGLQIKARYGHWRIDTHNHEDHISLQRLNVNLADAIAARLKRIMEFHKSGIIGQDFLSLFAKDGDF